MSVAPPDIVTSSCIGRVVKFGGEFGNQLFQTAAVLGYAERHGCAPVFHAWQCAFSGRDYGRLFPLLDYRDNIAVKTVFEQKSFRYEDIPHRPGCDLRGTLQSEKYFPRDQTVLPRVFTEPAVIKERVDAIIRERNLGRFSAVHLRYYDRPDRDSTANMHTLPEHYYVKAIERLDLSLPLVLVSNNPVRALLFARRHLAKVDYIIQCDPDQLVDFYLLTRANHLAIGNSTFGWWAGYLNTTAPSIYAPTRKKWFSFTARTTPYWDATDIYSPKFTEMPF